MWPGSKQKKRNQLRLTAFPAAWRQVLAARCPYFRRLSPADHRELEGLIQVFLAEKRFEGCGGFAITDETRVCVAAFACLLLLHRQTDDYPSLRSILVYPNQYVVPSYRHVGSGILEEFPQARAGESWPEGAVVLAWDVMEENLRTPGSGFNLVLHEFAHQLDFEDGYADGVPLLAHGEPLPARVRRYRAWTRVMRAEFARLQGQVQRGEETVLRDYGATNAAEFFAVATECFFGKPEALRRQHPELYEELQWYYRQDPASWAGVG